MRNIENNQKGRGGCWTHALNSFTQQAYHEAMRALVLGYASNAFCTLWYGGRTGLFWNAGLCFAFVFAKCCDKQDSPPTFLLSNKGKGENNRKRPFESFLSKGGRLSKGKVLAPFLSVVIHGLLGTCSLCFQKFAFLCDCGFWKEFVVLKRV